MHVNQVFIMAGGSGHRLEPITLYTPKFALQILDEPLLVKQLELVQQVNPESVHIMINNKDFIWAQSITDKVKDSYTYRIEIVVEKEKLGLTNAFNAIEAMLRHDYFMILFGDEYFYKSSFFSDLGKMEEKSYFGGVRSENSVICEGCNLVVKNNLDLLELIEKPSWDEVKSDLSWTGVAVFDRSLFDYNRTVQKGDVSQNMTVIDWLNTYISNRETSVIVDRGWNININRYDDYRKCLVMEMAIDNEKYSNNNLSFDWYRGNVYNSEPIKTV